MTTKREVQTPGEPTKDAFKADAQIIGEDTGVVGTQELDAPSRDTDPVKKVTAGAEESETVAAMRTMLEEQNRKIAELQGIVVDVQKRDRARLSNAPEAETVPTMKEVMESKPSVPVLTTEGWYVPEKTLATRA